MKRMSKDMIINNGTCSVCNSPSLGKRSSNENSMPANHDRTNRPTKRTIKATMTPSLMRC